MTKADNIVKERIMAFSEHLEEEFGVTAQIMLTMQVHNGDCATISGGVKGKALDQSVMLYSIAMSSPDFAKALFAAADECRKRSNPGFWRRLFGKGARK